MFGVLSYSSVSAGTPISFSIPIRVIARELIKSQILFASYMERSKPI